MDKKLPMDFVSEVYNPDYVSGWICVGDYLIVWYDDDAHIWGIDDEGLVPIPMPIQDRRDMENTAIDVYGGVTDAKVFMDIVKRYVKRYK